MVIIREKIKTYLDQIIGRTLDKVGLACEMMSFNFGDIALHAQCFTRILHKGRILVTTTDYQSWDGVIDTNNDEWYNLALHRAMIENSKVIKTKLTSTNDVLIWLENDIHIQIFISNSAPHHTEALEQWRIFERTTETPHIVVYSEGVICEE